MQWPSSREDCLRAIGHLLDETGAALVDLAEGDTALLVRPSGPLPAEGSYSTSQLAALLEGARARRGTGTSGPIGGYEQTLRALGQVIDRDRGRSLRLRQVDGSFNIHYIAYAGAAPSGGGPIRHSYIPSMLTALIERGPRLRRQTDL